MKKVVEVAIIVAGIIVLMTLGKSRIAEFFYSRGSAFYKQKAYEKATSCFNISLKIRPDAAAVHYARGRTFEEMGQGGRAIHEYGKAVELDKKYVEAYRELADIHAGQGDYSQAKNVLNRGLTEVPGDPKLQDLLKKTSFNLMAKSLNGGVTAMMSGNKAEARDLLKKAVATNPESPHPPYTLACFHYMEHNYPAADQLLRDAIRLDPKFSPAYGLLGDIYFKEGNFQKAIEQYQISTSLDDKDALVWNNIGLAYMNLEKCSEAVPFLEKALALNPKDLRSRYNLASVYRDSGKWRNAGRQYLKLLKLQPDYPNAHNDLGDIYKNYGWREKAITQYRQEIFFASQRLEKNPGDPETLTELAHAYNGAGEFDRAREFVDQALTIDPEYRRAYMTLADIYRNLGRSQDALATLEKANRLSFRKYSFIDSRIADIKEQFSGAGNSR